MIGKEKSIVRVDSAFHICRELRRAWSGVRHQRYATQPQDNLRQQRRHEVLAGKGKTGCGGRMCMNHGPDVHPCPVDREVQRQFGGRATHPAHHAAIQVDANQVTRLHPPFPHPGRCHENQVGIQPDRDVAILTGDQPRRHEPRSTIDDRLGDRRVPVDLLRAGRLTI